MTVARIAVAIGVALSAQATLAWFAGGARANVDLPLVAVVLAALSGGPMVGLWTGTVAGFAQDVLSGGLVGVSGLSKSLVGLAAGGLATQILVTGVWRRSLILAAATGVHAACFVGVYALMPGVGPTVSAAAVGMQAAANVAAGIGALGMVRHWPGFRARLRAPRRDLLVHRRRMS